MPQPEVCNAKPRPAHHHGPSPLASDTKAQIDRHRRVNVNVIIDALWMEVKKTSKSDRQCLRHFLITNPLQAIPIAGHVCNNDLDLQTSRFVSICLSYGIVTHADPRSCKKQRPLSRVIAYLSSSWVGSGSKTYTSPACRSILFPAQPVLHSVISAAQ